MKVKEQKNAFERAADQVPKFLTINDPTDGRVSAGKLDSFLGGRYLVPKLLFLKY